MNRDLRLCRMLHVLIHMSGHHGAVTSDAIARMLGTNPVVIRRTMAGLREHGHVVSEKGHGGGWRLARPLSEITLLDVHRALGAGAVFVMGPANDQPECRIEQAVNALMGEAFAHAEAVLLKELGSRTLDGIAEDFAPRRAACSDEAANV